MNPPANWYPDPTGRHDQRYWDGEQWTEHVFTDGVQGVDPLEQAVAAEETATSEADGLFVDAGDRDAWSPGEEGSGPADAGDAVAADVEAADVVATLDEVADASPPQAADDPGSTTGDGPPAAGDLSDAFILAPETASRIVRRRATEAGEQADERELTEETAGGAGTDAVEAAAGPTGPTEPSEAEQASTGGEHRTTEGTTAGDGDLGITGDLLGGVFAERSGAGPVALQNSRLLRCSVTPGAAVVARQGTMVAYQGEVSFERQGAGGVTRALKRAATGEGLAMMRADGSGDVFFADGGQHVFLLQLAGGPGLSVNGRNVLAFSTALQWDIERVKGASLLAGGLFNTTFTGNGWVALVSDGEPVVLQTDEAPTHVDVNALVAWSAGLSTSIVNSVSARSLVGLGSGEAFQMAFDGAGVVIVQPSEGPLGGAAAT